MQDCTFWLLDHSAAVSIDDCNNCKIYVGPVESRCGMLPTLCSQLLCTRQPILPVCCSVFVRDCRGCCCSVICRQFRCGLAGTCPWQAYTGQTAHEVFAAAGHETAMTASSCCSVAPSPS